MVKDKTPPTPDFAEERGRFWKGIFAGIPPIPALSVSEWAAKYAHLPPGSSESGKMNINRLPYQVEPMDSVNDPEVAETVLWWGSQLGKSETINCILWFFVHADPSNVLMVQPTVELSEEYSKDRIAAGIECTPVLRGIVRDPKTRDSGNTIKSKRYPGGSLVLVGANAPSGLAGRPRRVILKDEIDRFPSSAGREGDPCALADRRAETYPNAVKVSTSTATIRGQSKIEALYELSDKRKWHVGCPRCAHEFVLMWKDIKIPEDRTKLEDSWMECPKCKAHLADGDRVAMVRAGKWKPTAKFKGIRGYWLSGLNTLFPKHKGFKHRLHQMVAEFLKAKAGGRDTMIPWINTFLAETYEEEAEAGIPAEELLARAEDYTSETIPKRVLVLVAAVDVQKDRVECEVVGFGVDDERWGIEKKVFDGDPEEDAVWNNLDTYLQTEFKREDGAPMEIDRTFVDMQYKSQRVLTFCGPRAARGVYPCRGINRAGTTIPPLLPAHPSRNNRAHVAHWNVGVTVAKCAIYDRLKLPLPKEETHPAPRVMHFPKEHGYDLDHFKQLTSEKRRVKFSYGQSYFVFEKPSDATRNEALDLAVYSLAALASLGRPTWQRRADDLLKRIPRGEDPTPTEAQQAAKVLNAPVRVPRRSWATSW
jgi:phage terminase large subunit GpA-like protein